MEPQEHQTVEGAPAPRRKVEVARETLRHLGAPLLAALDGYGDRSWDRLLLPG